MSKHNSTPSRPQPIAYSLAGLEEATSVSRAQLYLEIAAGRLVCRHIGRRTVVTYEDAVAWLSRLPRDNKGVEG